MAIGIGIGVQFGRPTGTLGATLAQSHYNRVIADGGVLPAGVSGLASVLDSIISAYSITSTSDFNTKVPVFLDPHYTGYKLGSGSGTTLGQAARTIYAINSSADVVQTTAASQPLLLAHSGTNYWFGSGVASNYCSTPNAAANQITGDIEIIAKCNFSSFSTTDAILNKTDGVAAGNAFAFYFFKTNASLSFGYSNSGTVGTRTTVNSSVTLSSVGITINMDVWVKVTRSVSTGDVKFYYSTDGVTYNQLGTTQSTTANAIANVNSSVVIGNWADTLHFFFGRIYQVKISNTIGGSPVVDFNPSSYSAATSQTQWTSTTGEVWTITKSTGSTFAGVLVNKTIAQGNNSTTSINCSSIAGTQTYTEYLVATKNGTGAFISRATGNARGHSGTNLTLANGATLNKADTATTTQTNTYLSKGASSSIAVNNGTATTGDSGSNNGTDLTIGQGAHNFRTLLQSSLDDSVAQRLAIYTLLRSINLY